VNNLKIGARLGLAFAAMLLITTLMAATGAWRLGVLRDTNRQIATVEAERNELALRWADNVKINWVQLSSGLKTSDPAQFETLRHEGAEVSTATTQVQQQLEALVHDEIGQRMLTDIAGLRARYVEARGSLLESKKGGEDVTAAVDRDLRPLSQAYLQALEKFAEHSHGLLTAVQAASASAATSSQWALGIGALVSLSLGILLATLATRSITRPILQAVQVAEAISEGTLCNDIQPRGRDESARLLQALAAMQARLAGIVGHVRQGSESVATASSEIAQGNSDLSARTEQQASALQETAASMEQLGSTIRHNAHSAEQASRLAASASAVAVQGGDVVGRVVQTMKGINDSSRRIGDIVGVIDGIAFQTNILALNAAVEAARAGEQGRGFAVVASEVRSLAQRCAQAAREIKGLIGTSVERVEQGSALVDRARSTMTEVVESIQRVAGLMGQISNASAEQSSGVAQVGQAVTQMDQATQQNAALVEQSAAAAESLRSQARQLVAAVAVFRLDPPARRAAN
jgi:methyl-accepting chemotaxis protein